MPNTPIMMTYQDAVEHLQDKEQSSASHPLIRRAIKQAYENDLPQHGDWKHYLTEWDLQLKATVSNTMTYDHTGGSNERQVNFGSALTGDALANITYYRVRVNSVNYPIEKYLNSSVVTLPESANPGADITAGTSCTIYRNRYTLPPDFKDLYPPLNESGIWQNQYITPQDMQLLERHVFTERSEPFRFTIMPDPNVFGQMAMAFPDIPSTATGMRFLYRRLNPELKYHGYETNILATTVSGSPVSPVTDPQTVTISSNISKSDWVGKFLRFGDTTNHPNGLAGKNPYVEQRCITAVSGTTITLDARLANTHASGTKYRITDPLDLRPTMIDSFLRGAEWKLDIMTNRKKESQLSQMDYYRAIRLAKESDSIVGIPQDRMSMYRNRGWTHAPVVTG